MQRLSSRAARAALAGLLLCAGLAVAAFAAPAQAAALQQDNVYLAGGEVRSPGPVAGDFVAAGGRVRVDQPVGGDLLAAGGAVDVRAPVQDDVRAVGGDVTLASRVGGELFAAGGHVALRPGAAVGGPSTVYGGSVSISGKLEGPLEIAAQKVTLDGEVQGDVRIAAEDIELGPATRISGGLHYVSAGELRKADGARIAGAVTREAPAQAQGFGGSGAQRAGDGSVRASAVSYLALLACGAVFLLLAPRLAAQASRRVARRPWAALGAGFATLVAVPLLAVLLFVTLLGIPLGIALMALYPVLLLAGFVVGVLYLAGLLPPALGRALPTRFHARIGWFALALLPVLLIARLPVLGGLAMGLVSLAGLGACGLELRARRRASGGGGGRGVRSAQPAGDAPRHA